MLNKDLLENNLQSGKASKKDRFCQKLHVMYLSEQIATAKKVVTEARQVMYEATRTTYAAFMAICSRELDDTQKTMNGLQVFDYWVGVAQSDAHYTETERNMEVAQKAFKVAEQVLKKKKKELRNFKAQVKHRAK